MATSKSKARRSLGIAGVVLLFGAVAVSLISAARDSRTSRVTGRGARAVGAGVPGALSRLGSASAPRTWRRATVASGSATLFYPPNWLPIRGDSGTVTAALRARNGIYHGYLNLTPLEGAEQLAGWAAFRTTRNGQEGDEQTRIVASAENLRVAGARASCVLDDYLSAVGSHPYRELACIVAGRHHTDVFVGATLASEWPTLGAVIERAAAALRER